MEYANINEGSMPRLGVELHYWTGGRRDHSVGHIGVAPAFGRADCSKGSCNSWTEMDQCECSALGVVSSTMWRDGQDIECGNSRSVFV
jgi:hypothetical protein